MQVTVEDISSVKKKLWVEIPQETVSQEMDKAYQDLKKKVRVKGFRPGKTPRSVLERLYRKNVQIDVGTRLIQESFVDAIKEKNLTVLGEPQIEPQELNETQPYQYEAIFEVNPEIEPIDYQGLVLKKYIYEISQVEVDAQLRALQKNFTRYIPIDETRPAREGDFLLIDYEGFKDGQPFSDIQKTENFTLELGKGQILKEFDEKLMGIQKDEVRNFTVSFPEDYPNVRLAGQAIDFQVHLQDIRKAQVPDLDEEFAKRAGNFSSVEELTEAIRNNLRLGYQKRQEQELTEQVFDALLAKHPFEVPNALIEAELDGIYKELERSFAQENKSLEKAGYNRQIIGQKHRDTAEKQVRRFLLLKRIIDQENLSLTDEDMESGYAEMAETMGYPASELKAYYAQNPEGLSFFKQSLLEKKAAKLIIDVSRIDEVAVENPLKAAAADTETK